MTLFEECKSALNEHFYQLTENESKIIKLKLEGCLNNELLNKPTTISIDNILYLNSEKKFMLLLMMWIFQFLKQLQVYYLKTYMM